MSRINKNVPSYTSFFDKLKDCLTNYSDRKNTTYGKYFSTLLGFAGNNASVQFSNSLNSNGKHLSVREFIMILEEIKGDSKPVLQILCDKAGLVCSEKAELKDDKFDDIKNMLLCFNVEQGDLTKITLDALKDNYLDNDELSNMISNSMNARSSLVKFEHSLKEIKKKR